MDVEDEISLEEGIVEGDDNNDDMEQDEPDEEVEEAECDPVSTEGSVLVGPKRKFKEASPVWECGGIKLPGCGSKCGICGKCFTGGSTNTSNLTEHIIKKHKDKAEGKKLTKLRDEKRAKVKEMKKKKAAAAVIKAAKPKQTSITVFTKRVGRIDLMKKKRIDKALVRMIVAENKPFSFVEKHNFREFVAALEPAYICPSKTTLTRMVDQYIVKSKEDLKKEFENDFNEVEDKVVHLTSDHGTSSDRFKSHKNALTVSRCTNNFVIKTDTVSLIHCDGWEPDWPYHQKRCKGKVRRDWKD